MNLPLQSVQSSVIVRFLGLLLGLAVAFQVSARPHKLATKAITSSAVSFTNPCGLTAPTLSPSTTVVTVGGAPVSIVATGCPGGIIQYFGPTGGVYTVAPGGTISVPTSATGTYIITALCSFSGCISDVSVATITVNPVAGTGPDPTPVVSNTIASQTAVAGTSYFFTIPSNTFTDPNNDPLTYTASGLPSGVTLTGSVISGPLYSAINTIITITATNTHGFSVSTNYNLNVSAAPALGNPDLTPTISLPSANFTSSGPDLVKNFTVGLYEVAGLQTSSGNVQFTITAPFGYTISFDGAATSVDVSGGTTTSVNNADWSVTSNNGLQLTLTMKTGKSIAANGNSLIGFVITRTVANGNSTANLTINITDDSGHTYDGSSINNIYVRNINALN